MKRYKSWIALTIVGIILYGIIVLALVNNYEDKQRNYLATEMEAFSSKIMTTLSTYEKFSNYVFKQVIDQPYVMELMYDANHRTDIEKIPIRQALYNHLFFDYELIIQHDFRQLHFHLANGDSFLRFHSPSNFGDNLMDVRDSIRLANTEHRYVFGFEEGRIFNGYRFVYPLFHNNTHVGSVEVSISMASLMEVLKDLYPEIDTFFVIDQEVVERIVFADQQSNYELHPYLPGYYSDLNIMGVANRDCSSIEETRCFLFGRLMDKEPNVLASKESFNRVIYYQGTDYLVQFKAIENISSEPVAYFIGISEQDNVITFYDSVGRDILLVSALFILLFVSTFIYQKKQYELEILSSTDKLTGLYNRHKLVEIAEREVERFERYDSSISVVLLDIDLFKRINDQYGHGIGDEVLVQMGEVLKETVRKQDIVARWGGEEFLMLLIETGLEEAAIIAERCRKNIEAHLFPKVGQVTASLGVATIQEKESLDTLINRADLAMYEAKTSGRNQVRKSE